MDRKWLPLNALRAFEAAGRKLSFTAAAQGLTVAQSAVSRHVIVLEQFLGTPLFERRPQRLVLTAAGRHLLPAVTKSFDRIDDALAEIIKEKGKPRRVLKVFLSTTFAYRLGVPLLRDFRVAHPEIELDVASKPATGVDLDVEVDVAVVYTEPRVTETVLDLLWTSRSAVVCRPDVAARHKEIADAIAAEELLHIRLDGRPRHFLWEMFVRSIGRPDIAVDRGLAFDSSQMSVQYALEAGGLALVDPRLFEDDLSSGKLVAPFDVRLEEGFGSYLSTHPQDLDDEAVSLFRSWMIARCAKQEPPRPSAEPEATPAPLPAKAAPRKPAPSNAASAPASPKPERRAKPR
ncbi:MAG: LysR family transcriptional regulator [Hyphomicrobiales bacterium]|nr:LysR family transcriptional regulator [Hyphomicrobiales bacterium]